jgi:hypothetical protein
MMEKRRNCFIELFFKCMSNVRKYVGAFPQT